MDNVEIELASQVGGVLEKAYDDMVHPSAASVGNTISLIPRTKTRSKRYSRIGD